MAGDRAPRLRVTEIALFERDVHLRLPFRFGVVTLTEAPQAFARVRIQLADGREAAGVAAEVLAPKWFDKDLRLSNDDNFDQLRGALAIAARLYRAAPSTSAFGLFQGCYRAQIAEAAKHNLNSLVAGFGPALLDRAVLDALCRLHQVSLFQAMATNLAGLAASELTPDLVDFDVDRFVRALSPPASIEARHTVGLIDPIASGGGKVNDGLPETLAEVVAAYGQRNFKLKVGGNLVDDLARLTEIASVLDRIEEPYRATLDGNEQYQDVEPVKALLEAIARMPALARLNQAILFVEQPIARQTALDTDIAALGSLKPLLIDESDDSIESFPRAKSLGYRGVSAKGCKGLYKSILNAARCARWNAEEGGPRYFMSAEDLTTQAGVCVQQDLALAALIGCDHVERNGHHYVNGMAGLPASEQAGFLAAHPDLYHRADGVVRLTITRGRIALGSLDCVGFATAAEPAWSAMRRADAVA